MTWLMLVTEFFGTVSTEERKDHNEKQLLIAFEFVSYFDLNGDGSLIKYCVILKHVFFISQRRTLIVHCKQPPLFFVEC